MTPFEGARVIPRNWSARHRGVVARAGNATVTVRVQGEPVYNPATDDTTAAFTTIWSGAALINPAASTTDTAQQAADTMVGTPYTVQLAEAVNGIKGGHQVHVDACPNDTDFVDAVLWVVMVIHGSEQFSRVLLCSTSSTDAP